MIMIACRLLLHVGIIDLLNHRLRYWMLVLELAKGDVALEKRSLGRVRSALELFG
jgi:hypothetical protein